VISSQLTFVFLTGFACKFANDGAGFNVRPIFFDLSFSTWGCHKDSLFSNRVLQQQRPHRFEINANYQIQPLPLYNNLLTGIIYRFRTGLGRFLMARGWLENLTANLP
jgi:hypothetical protein